MNKDATEEKWLPLRPHVPVQVSALYLCLLNTMAWKFLQDYYFFSKISNSKNCN